MALLNAVQIVKLHYKVNNPKRKVIKYMKLTRNIGCQISQNYLGGDQITLLFVGMDPETKIVTPYTNLDITVDTLKDAEDYIKILKVIINTQNDINIETRYNKIIGGSD